MLAVLNQMNRPDTPILVLSCHLQEQSLIENEVLAREIGLSVDEIDKRPWGVFDVNTSDMKGMVGALDWVLYHVQKKRSDIQYHKYNGQ